MVKGLVWEAQYFVQEMCAFLYRDYVYFIQEVYVLVFYTESMCVFCTGCSSNL